MLALVRGFSAIGVPEGLVLELAVVMVTVDAAGVGIEVEDLGLITNVNHSLMVSHGGSCRSLTSVHRRCRSFGLSYKLLMGLPGVSIPGQPRT